MSILAHAPRPYPRTLMRRPPRRLARTVLPLAGLAALAAAVGCSSRARVDPNPPPHYTAPVVLDAAAPPGTYLPVERATADTLNAATADSPVPATPRPLNVLAVSGGGQFGSYAAGVLIGWSCRGDRPQFDVVTGISSGALVAVLVYAGQKYDPVLQRLFTSLRTEDIFRYQPLLVHLVRDKALGTGDPLKRLLEETITDEFLADMRAAHAAGRRLFVGTMNQLTRRPVFWDLGAIASSGSPCAGEDVRRILLATASISGQLPPVPIDVEVNGAVVREYHNDCGGVVQTFVRFGPEAPRPDPRQPDGKWLAGSNLYIISGGKLYKEILDRPPGFISAILSNVSANLYALFRADCWRLYTLCAVSGMKFHMTLIPAEAYTGEKSTAFDPEIQRQLFAIGYDLITQNRAWRFTPPGYEPGEEDLPRAGFRFAVPPPGAMPAPVPGVVVAPDATAQAQPTQPTQPRNGATAPAVETAPTPRPLGRIRNFHPFEVPKL